MIDYEEYENIPLPEKWMAHATMPATAFFRLWKRKFEKLVWMALYDPKGSVGTAQWYVTAGTPQEEEDMLASDDEFEPDADEEGGSESDGEEDGNVVRDEEEKIPNEEVDELMEDAYGEEAHQKQKELQTQDDTVGQQPVDLPASELADQRNPILASLNRKTKVGPSPTVENAL